LYMTMKGLDFPEKSLAKELIEPKKV
jgi:hypothetical protein